MQESFDVTIVGRGIAGLSTAWYLKQLGVERVCLVGPDRCPGKTASLNAGYGSITLQDNITRAAHGLGATTASEILNLNRRGFSELTKLANKFGASCEFGQVYRISSSAHETEELEKATSWLKLNGYPASLEKTSGQTIQRDGSASASIDIMALLDRLELACGYRILDGEISTIDANPTGMTLYEAHGMKIKSEVVALCCHTGIKRLIPAVTPFLVNFSDQLIQFDHHHAHDLLKPGNLIFSDHSQFWVSASYDGTIYAGGARYLRKWGGIEAETAQILDTVTLAVKDKIESLLNLKLGDIRKTVGILDLRACDEIPVIGPMFGDSRVLLAGGFMGSGLTFGCAAGKGLAEIIFNGVSSTVPNMFHPARLRSLPDID